MNFKSEADINFEFFGGPIVVPYSVNSCDNIV